jgi:hypothetical protein
VSTAAPSTRVVSSRDNKQQSASSLVLPKQLYSCYPSVLNTSRRCGCCSSYHFRAGPINSTTLQYHLRWPLIYFITAKLIPAALPVVTVDRSVHAALCIFHQVSGGRQTGRQTCRGKLMMSDQTGMRLGGECQDVEWCVQSKIEDVRTEFISFCSHGCSNVRRDLSNVGEGWEDRSRDKVLLCGLIS